LYLLLAFLVILKFKWKSIYIFIFIGLLILISDQTSVKLFKDVFMRYRPCYNLKIMNFVHTVNGHCGGRYGFVSSHATNSFALAVFVGLLLKTHYKNIFTILLLWASIIAYSRMYLGVHYPADVLGGAILGSIIGFILLKIMTYVSSKFNLKINLT